MITKIPAFKIFCNTLSWIEKDSFKNKFLVQMLIQELGTF